MKIKTNINGKETEVEEVDVINSNEGKWTEYQLSDGNVLSIKSVMIVIHKVIGHTTPDGKPIYNFTIQNIARVK